MRGQWQALGGAAELQVEEKEVELFLGGGSLAAAILPLTQNRSTVILRSPCHVSHTAMLVPQLNIHPMFPHIIIFVWLVLFFILLWVKARQTVAEV